MNKYNGIDRYVSGLGTVRECIDCGALLAGGPTRCIRCILEGPPKYNLWNKLKLWLKHQRMGIK